MIWVKAIQLASLDSNSLGGVQLVQWLSPPLT